MEKKITDLQQFQAELDQHRSLAEVAICVTSFFDKQLGWRARLISRGLSGISAQVRNNPRLLAYPVSSHYMLFVQTPAAPAVDDVAFARLVAGLLAGVLPGIQEEQGPAELLVQTSALISGASGAYQRQRNSQLMRPNLAVSTK